MHLIKVRDGEPNDRALKRLKSKVYSDGLMDELRRLRSFETPQQKNKRKLKKITTKEKSSKGLTETGNTLPINIHERKID